MLSCRLLHRIIRWSGALALALSCYSFVSMLSAQGAKQNIPESRIPDADADHVKERNEWFLRGRVVQGRASAELRHRAYITKMQMRLRRAAALAASTSTVVHSEVSNSQLSNSQSSNAQSLNLWTPLGPLPLASDASGNGTQDYHQVSGRATAVAIDPADPTGNTIYIGGAQSGVWKSTNAASDAANTVTWTPVTDDQATLSIGAIAIQPGNTNPATTVILAATGEANNSADSYFGLGVLRSADAGTTWTLIPTANSGALSFSGLGGARMAFSTASGQMNTVVAAMATTPEGTVEGDVTANTTPGLYTSVDAGQTWTYDALADPGGAANATSATSIVYNASAGLFFAAVRYHGLYSSPNGVTWTRLAVQPGGAVLNSAACPPVSTSNNYACPIYRGEISVVPGRNEMYAWYISLTSHDTPVDGGIWQSLNGGASWTAIPDTTITNCSDLEGCGVDQGSYNLELLAVANGSATDLYAGAINLYKCSITTQNPTCAITPFMNLTHVYGCDPTGAPAHVHPYQHALAYTIPVSGSDSGNALLYFANDGGIYRALNGFSGLNTGSCSGTNQFDDLNQNLGSMTQFVSFSQHPSDPNTLLGGAGDNGSPATAAATTSSSWGNVLGGDGGYNAIDPVTPSNWYASNPDVAPGGLGVQLCMSGVNCTDSGFSAIVTSNSVGGDDGAFYFPYILDPASSAAMLVGTCRVWRGARTGGAFTALSPNFDTLGSGTCTGSEVNQVRALEAGGPTDGNGSEVIYATTSGPGPVNSSPNGTTGGRVWATADATAGIPAFTDVTNNGTQGNINPNQFPVSGVAMDSSDATGGTVYVTVMGFTGGPGHVWKSTNFGAGWIDYTANLPDSPVNAVVVFPALSQIYVATDVGVFSSSTSTANWTEVGPIPGVSSSGYLPNVAVTALGVFNSGGQQLLRVSTYGRGVWQFNLAATPDFQISLTNSPQTISLGATATFQGSISALDGYSGTVTVSCVAGATPAPSTCTPSATPVTAGNNFTVTAGGAAGDYFFNVQGVGSGANPTTHLAAATLHILGSFALSDTGSFPTVNAGSSTTSGPINVTAPNGFTGTINLTCSLVSGTGSCSVNPSSITSIPSTPSVTVNATALSAGSYQMLVQGTSGSTTHALLIPYNVGDFQIAPPQSFTLGPGTQGAAGLTLTSTYYSGNVSGSCSVSSLPGATCVVTPSPALVTAGSTIPLAATINVPNNAAPGMYDVSVNLQDSTGIPSHNVSFNLIVEDFALTSFTTSQSVSAGGTTLPYNLSVGPVGTSFASPITLSCSGLPAGAQCNFVPAAPITPGSSAIAVAMTIATSSTTNAATYPITIVAKSGALSHSASVSLIVTTVSAAGSDFQLAVTQAFPSGVAAGAQVTAQASITSDYSGSVKVNCDASAISGQCLVTPSGSIAISSSAPAILTVTLNIPNNAAPGTYNINLSVTDLSGQPSHTLQMPLTVMPDFSVTSATPSQTLSAGQTTTGAYQITVAPNPVGSSFAGTVTLSCASGLPTGGQCIFNPSTPVTLGSGSAAVVMTITVPSGTASLRSRGGISIVGHSVVGHSIYYAPYYALWFLFPGIAIVCSETRRCSRRCTLGVTALLLLMLTLFSCGGVSNGGSTTGTTGNQPVIYQITVTGTSPGAPPGAGQSASVTLVVD